MMQNVAWKDWWVFLVIACKLLLSVWLTCGWQITKQPEDREKAEQHRAVMVWPDKGLTASGCTRVDVQQVSKGDKAIFCPLYPPGCIYSAKWAGWRPLWLPVHAACLHLRLALCGLRGSISGVWAWKYTQKRHCLCLSSVPPALSR